MNSCQIQGTVVTSWITASSVLPVDRAKSSPKDPIVKEVKTWKFYCFQIFERRHSRGNCYIHFVRPKPMGLGHERMEIWG